MYWGLFALKLILGGIAYLYIEMNEDRKASIAIGSAVGITIAQYMT